MYTSVGDIMGTDRIAEKGNDHHNTKRETKVPRTYNARIKVWNIDTYNWGKDPRKRIKRLETKRIEKG